MNPMDYAAARTCHVRANYFYGAVKFDCCADIGELTIVF